MLQQASRLSRRRLRPGSHIACHHSFDTSTTLHSLHSTLRTFSSSTFKRRLRHRQRRLEVDNDATTTKTKKKKPPPATIREKRFKLVQQNLHVRPSRPVKVNQLLATAQGRVTWLRDKLYSHWNPDHNLVTAATTPSGATAESAAAAAAKLPRPPLRQTKIRMDARWWFWNTCFAILPAVMIGVYCEFFGKYAAYEFHQQQELENMRRLMGEEFVAEYAEDLLLPPPENLATRLVRLGRDLQMLVMGRPVGDNAMEEDGSDQGQLEQSQTTQHGADDKASSLGSAGTPLAITSKDSAGSPPSSPSAMTGSDASTQALLERIQRLEEMIHVQESHGDGQKFDYQLDRMDQSDIQNRMEDEKIKAWKKRIAEKRSMQKKTLPKTPSHQPIAKPASDAPAPVKPIEEDSAPNQALMKESSKLSWSYATNFLRQKLPGGSSDTTENGGATHMKPPADSSRVPNETSARDTQQSAEAPSTSATEVEKDVEKTPRKRWAFW